MNPLDTEDQPPTTGSPHSDGLAETPAPRVAAPPGYEILHEVGSGGMGVVYRARDVALDRPVALKYVHARHAAHPVVVRRFAHEARITARLQHPAIPPVYQVGALPDGRPFLAMKFIQGHSLDERLRDAEPGAGRWLGVFEAVCQAVGYAHSQGVIHRDLKPGNVMVGAFGEVQVMDWGLAKVLAAPQRAEDDPLATTEAAAGPAEATVAGTVMGTPACMPPEQAIGAIDKLDRRSDVFGLGAILCALLTGKPPFVGPDSEATRQLAARAKLDDAFARLDGCGAEPELVALAKRCLAAEQGDRPADAGVLADEVADLRRRAEERARLAEMERWQASVQAQEQRRRRRLRRLAAAALAAVLLAGVVGTTIGMIQANVAAGAERRAKSEAQQAARNEKEANEQAQIAKGKAEQAAAAEKAANERTQRRAAQIEKANHLLANLLHDVNPHYEDKDGPTLYEQLAERASKAADGLDGEAVGDPLAVARLQTILGGTLRELGDVREAVVVLEKARATRRRELGADHPDTLRTNFHLALAYRAAGKLPEAITLFEHVRDVNLKRLGADHPDVLATLGNLALAYKETGRLAEAIELFERLREVMVKKLGPDHPHTLTTLNNLALALGEADRLPEALALFEQVHRAQVKELGEDHPVTLTTLNNLANAYRETDKLARAVELLEQVRDVQVKKWGASHPSTLTTLNNLAMAYRAADRLPEAVDLFEQVHEAQLQKLGPDHPHTLGTMNNLAVAYQEAGKPRQAVKLLQQGRAAAEKKLGADHPTTLATLVNLAAAYREADRLPEAILLFEKVRDAQVKTLGADHSATLVTRRKLAEAYQAAGKLPEAIELLEKVRNAQAKKLGPDHSATLETLSKLALAYREADRLPEGVKVLEKVRDARAKKLGPDHSATFTTMNNLALFYQEAGKLPEAIELFGRLRDAKAKKLGADHPDTLSTIGSLAWAYRVAGKPGEALPLFEQAASGIEKRRFLHPHAYPIVNATVETYEQLGKLDRGESWRRRLMAFVKARAGADSPIYAGELAALGLNLLRQKKWAEAEKPIRESLSVREKKAPDSWATFNTRSMLGGALLGQKKYDEAEPLLLAGFEGMKKREKTIPPQAKARLVEAADRLIELYVALEKPDEAKKWRAERDELAKQQPKQPEK